MWLDRVSGPQRRSRLTAPSGEPQTMTLAIFGISNDGLNLVVNLLILMLVVVWLALIVFTFLDARRRVSDPFLVACATSPPSSPTSGPPSTRSCGRRSSSRTRTSANSRSRPPSCGSGS